MSTRKRQTVSFALIAAGVGFGMVLASDLQWSAPSFAESRSAGGGPIIPKVSTSQVALPSFADLAEAVEPAVVSVQASTIEEKSSQGPSENPLEFFFRQRGAPGRPGAPQEEGPGDRSESGGSGFVISADGLIVTNNHVIRGADKVVVKLGERNYDAEIKGVDAATDLALLKIDAGQDLPYLALGSTEDLRSGDWVMAVGDPLGLENTVTTGVVSAKGRSIGLTNDPSFENFIQTDAAINFGNSGGPLINLKGEVVGINTAMNFGAENIGFAVPVETLKAVLPQLRDSGKVRRGYLGINIGNVDFDTAEAFGLDKAEGALVSSVVPGRPADKAGIQHGDIILSVDGRKVKTTRDLIDYVSAKGPDAAVEVEVLRNGERVKKKIQLAERESQGEDDEAPAAAEEARGIEWLGVRYQDLTPGLRQAHGIGDEIKGVLVTQVQPTSPLWEEGLRNQGVMYVVTEVNGSSVSNVAEFEKAVRTAKPGSRLRLYVHVFAQGQEGQPRFILPRVPKD